MTTLEICLIIVVVYLVIAGSPAFFFSGSAPCTKNHPQLCIFCLLYFPPDVIYYNYTEGEMEWEVPLSEIASYHIEKLGRF